MEATPMHSLWERAKEQSSPNLSNHTATPISDSPLDQPTNSEWHTNAPADPPPQYESAISIDENGLKHWNAHWLRRSSLTSISTSLTLLAIAALVTLQLSNKEDGLKIVIDSHYLWTYGPTALLILLTAIWRQIDFYCKAVIPWAVLKKQETPARESVLLDYISPIQWTSFRNAYYNKHHVVVLSTIGFNILKLMTLASTAFLTPHTIYGLQSNTNVTKSSFKQGLDDSGSVSAGLFEPAIAYEAFAISGKGLPPSLGTTEDFAYETVRIPADVGKVNASFSTTVRALVPNFECQSAPFNIIPQPVNSTDLHPADRIVLAFPECTLRASGDGTPLYALNPQVSRTPPQQLSPLRQQIDCQGTSDNWQLLTLVDFRYNQTLDGNDASANIGDTVQSTSWSTGVARSTGIACKSSYTLEDARLEYRSDTGSFVVERLGTREGRLLNFSDPNLGELTNSAIFAASDMFGNKVDNAFAQEYPDVMFKMMGQLVNGTYDDLFNETTMAAVAQRVYQQVAIQAMKTHLTGAGQEPVLALLSSQEDRLKVSEPVAVLTIIGSILIAIIAVWIMFIRPWNATFQNPELPATMAAVLARSDGMQSMLNGARASGTKLKQALTARTFSSGFVEYEQQSLLRINAFQLVPLRSSSDSEIRSEKPSSVETWYKPATMKGWFLFVSFFFPPVLVGILEGLQHMSCHHGGIAKVNEPNNQIIALLPQILSALIMMLIATNFNSLEFNILSLAPFERLRNKYESLSSGLLTAYIGRVPPMVLCVAFLAQHWAVLLISSSALMGSFLTVVVSGLYTFDPHFPTSVARLRQLDQLAMNWNGSVVNDNGAAVVTSLTESIGLEYPAFTYRDLAFPALAAVPLEVQDLGLDALLEAQMPAARASLQCTRLDQSAFNFSASFNAFIESASASISAELPLPSGCQRGGPSGNLSFIEFDHSFSIRSNTSYVAKMLDIHVGPFDEVLAAGADELDPNNQQDNPPECPTLAFIYGYADTQDSSKTTASILSCYQRVDQITTNLTFTASNMSLSLPHPPIPDEASQTPILKPSTNSPFYPFRIQPHFDNSFVSNDQFNNPSHNNCSFRDPSIAMPADELDGSNPPLDPFFQGVLCGSYPYLPLTTFRQTDNASSTQIFNSIQGMYRRYMAQAISSNMRQPLTDALLPRATLLNAKQETRLVQHRLPKIILQCMLGAMTVLSGLAVYMSRLWEPIMPYNPCTIAGTMALFAGSEMCDPKSEVCKELFPDGVQRMSEEELRRLWRGWDFKLGWWNGKGGRRWGVQAVRAAR